jgi:molybdopterin-guanine dinucleotide biosynthesis protein A
MPDEQTTARIAMPSMLLIGSAGRGSGRSLLAERILEARARAHGIDGARAVLRLHAREDCPRAEAGALADRIGPTTVSLCESNGLRRVVDPGLFAIVRRRGRGRVERACRSVWPLADVVVSFDGERHDPPADAFGLVDGRWTIRREATAIVLAGGRSSRMGRDKALLPVGGRTMIEHVVDQLRPHFAEILVSAGEPERYTFLGLEIAVDHKPGLGPMAGVASALARSRHEVNFVVSCDLASVPVDLMSRLLREARTGADVIVPVTANSHYEPLFAVYRRRVRPLLERALEGGARKLDSIYDGCETRTMPLRADEVLRNINTAGDYRRLIEERE